MAKKEWHKPEVRVLRTRRKECETEAKVFSPGKKAWRKPEVIVITAGSAEKGPANTHSDGGVNKS